MGFLLHALKEEFIQQCELLRSDSLENELSVEGEYASESKMRDEWGRSEPLGVIM